MSYAPLYLAEAEAKTDVQQNEAATEVISGKKYLLAALRHVTERIDVETEKTFAPRKKIRSCDLTQKFIDWDANQFWLPEPMVSVSEVSILGTALTVWDGNYAHRANADYTSYPRNETPFNVLQGLRGWLVWDPYRFGENLLGNQADFLDAISIDGIWCYRSRYTEEGWKASGDSVQDDSPGINSSVTTITVDDINGSQYNGDTPRFSPGQWVQIEDEWLEVIATDISDDDTPIHTLTVIRGVRGSTAAAHAQDTSISIWYPEPNIVRAALRWTAYLYNRRSIYQTEIVNAAGTFTISFPTDVPDEVAGLLTPFTSQGMVGI